MIGVTTQAFFTLACLNGVGWHVHEISLDQLWKALKWTWIGIYVGLVGTFVGKLAIVALLYQVATRQQKRRKYFLLFIGGFNVLCGSIQLILSITQCDPYTKLWYRLEPGTCNHIDLAAKFGYFQGCKSPSLPQSSYSRDERFSDYFPSRRNGRRSRTRHLPDHDRLESPSILAHQDRLLRPHGRRCPLRRRRLRPYSLHHPSTQPCRSDMGTRPLPRLGINRDVDYRAHRLRPTPPPAVHQVVWQHQVPHHGIDDTVAHGRYE